MPESPAPPDVCCRCWWWSSNPGEADGHCYKTETSAPATYSCEHWTLTSPEKD